MTATRSNLILNWPPIAEAGVATTRPLMFVFYRGQWCEHCQEQLVELGRAAEQFEHRGAGIVAVTTDDADGITTMVDLTGARFPILRDRHGELIRSLDLVDPFEFRAVPVSLPAVFLIDGSGVVRFHYVGRSPDDRPRLELLLLAAERLSMETC